MTVHNESRQATPTTADPARPTVAKDPTATEVKEKIGSVEFQIKEVDVSRPARSVNRMWPNR